jgi:flagellar hook protein FlgE
MLDVMTRAKNAIEAYNSQLQINSANIANMSVTGYKALNISFQTVFERVMNGGTAAANDSGGTNPVQLGSSVAVGNVKLDFSQGTLSQGGNLDMAVQGTGLFVVSPDDGQTYLYTRAGHFQIDNQGNLLTDTGMQVYGLSGGSLVPITGLNNFHTDRLSWSNDGRLVEYGLDVNNNVDFTNEAADTGYRIALTSFANLTGLAQAAGNTFSQTLASGDPLEYKTSGDLYGVTVPRNIEASNVFYTGEIIDSMEAQRAMSGNLTMLRMISDEISSFISKIS